LSNFIARHGIATDLPSRVRKLRAEVNELDEAVLDGDKTETIKEAADCAIIAFHILQLCGVNSPLFTMHLKLEEVSARPKYRAMAERVAAV
jgi:hypothetical protein